MPVVAHHDREITVRKVITEKRVPSTRTRRVKSTERVITVRKLKAYKRVPSTRTRRVKSTERVITVHKLKAYKRVPIINSNSPIKGGPKVEVPKDDRDRIDEISRDDVYTQEISSGLLDFSHTPSWLVYKKSSIVNRVVGKRCIKRILKFSGLVKKYRCVRYTKGQHMKMCVQYKIQDGKRRCIKKAVLYRIRHCQKWNKKSLCKKYMHVSTDLRCSTRAKLGGKKVCLKYRVRVPRIYCQHYRMINDKRVCARTGVFYPTKSGKLVCTKRAKSMVVVSAKSVISSAS